jgi:hypothetical protein
MDERPEVASTALAPIRPIALGSLVFRPCCGLGSPRCSKSRGGTDTFRAIEVDGDERDRVIAAFRARADKLMTRDFDRRPGADDHPTFRVERVSS